MTDCDGDTKDLLPALAAGRLEPGDRARVGAHARSCEDCAAELATLRLLVESRPELPRPLADRIAGEVAKGLARPTPDRRRLPRWALAAAAGVVLALGTPSLLQRMGSDGTDVGAELDDEVFPTAWLSEAPLIAGAPLLDGLSDEALARLLEEMEG
jgi:anti-sigma factor RsiW